MNSTTRVCVVLCVLILAMDAIADSYAAFADMLEVDRHGVLFANVRGFTTSSKERASVVVWTRLHPEALKRHLRQQTRPQKPSADLGLSAGPISPIRTVFERTFDRHPHLVRISSSAIAIMDFHAINYGQLKRLPAVRIVAFDGTRELSFRLEKLFANGTERYHNGRGLVQWLHDAWFDEKGRRLFVISTRHHTNPHGHEVAIVDLDSGQVSSADRAVIKEQLARLEPRFLHSALDVAISYGVDGINDVATRIFKDKTMPIVARIHAAAHLAKLGNAEAFRLIRELSKLSGTEPSDVRHPAISRTFVFEHHYWWNTIGYANRVHDQMSAAKKGVSTSTVQSRLVLTKSFW